MAAFLTQRRAYLLSVFLLLGAVLALGNLERGEGGIAPRIHLADLPLEVGGWRGEELPVSARERSILGTDNLILRRYRKGNTGIRLYILECRGNRASFHPPEYCYVGGRTELVEKGRETVRWEDTVVSAHRYLFRGPRGNSLVYYWYSFGRNFIDSYYRQQFLIISNLLLGRLRSAHLIRISMEGEFNPHGGDETIKKFIKEVMPIIAPRLLSEKPVGSSIISH